MQAQQAGVLRPVTLALRGADRAALDRLRSAGRALQDALREGWVLGVYSLPSVCSVNVEGLKYGLRLWWVPEGQGLCNFA